MEKEIVLLKLDTGDTVICRKVAIDRENIIVEHPLNIIYNPVNGNMLMLPFLIGAKQDSQIVIQKSHIVASVSESGIDKSLSDKYLESISDLVIANDVPKLEIVSN